MTAGNEIAERRSPSAQVYGAIRRWHFYFGLFIAPFFLIAALTGVVMALNGPIERAVYGDRLFVAPAGAPLPAELLQKTVADAFTTARMAAYIPPSSNDQAARFILVGTGKDGPATSDHGQHERLVFVDPYRGVVLGSLDPERTPYAIAKKLHGSLFLGSIGEHLIEIVAGFGILMIVTGPFLQRPRSGDKPVAPLPSAEKRGRRGWRSFHAAAGLWLAPILLFFLVSGLAWTPVWGGKLVQAWSSFPAERFAAPVGREGHAALDHGDHRQAPWALAQTPMPLSSATEGSPPGLDEIVALAKHEGFTKFRVNFPKGETGAWTVSAATISGDIKDPRADRTMHVDRWSGAVIADIGFADYSLAGKAMAAGVPLHQAGLGPWNVALNILFCLVVIAMIVAAAGMALARRRKGGISVSPPPMPANRRSWALASLALLGVSMLFPLTAGAIAVAAAAETLRAFFRSPRRSA